MKSGTLLYFAAIKVILKIHVLVSTNILTNTAIVLDGPRQHRAGFLPPSAAFLLVFEIIFVSFFLNVSNFWNY